MAPGAGLEIPRLSSASLDPFQPLTTYAGAFEVARNLLLAGVGAPEDWAECHADPVNFMLRTVKRSAGAFDRQVIDAVAHTGITLGTNPSPSSWREVEPNPNRLFLAVEATHISIVYLRQTFAVLAEADPRLPATFYEMLREALSPWILCYYLVLIGKIDLLRQLYARILVPPAVLAELKHPLAPKPVQDWVVNAPAWLDVLSPKTSLILVQLDLGESEAIALATEVHADVVLMDEQAGRQEAVRRGLRVAGALSVLDEAEQAGLVDFEEAVAELRETSFRVSLAVLAEIRAKRFR